jgi:hypothetical protein
VDDVALEIDEVNLALGIVRYQQGEARKRSVKITGAQARPSPFEFDLFNKWHWPSPSVVPYFPFAIVPL